MLAPRSTSLAIIACASLTLAGGAPPALSAPRLAATGPQAHSILSSRNLWATIDICSTPAHSRVLGIRGSMPGSGRHGERMYMRFRAEYLSPSDRLWHYVAKGADSSFQAVGSARFLTRQSGWSFRFGAPTAGAFQLRGVVEFQWRQKDRVVLRTRRITEGGHRSGAGADPPGFSAATCTIR